MKIGVVGVGHLGNYHVQQWCEIVGHSQVGCYDIDRSRLDQISGTYRVKQFNSINELIEECDIIDIVTPTQEHFSVAKKALESSKHVFLEKPACETVEEIDALIELQKKSKTHVGVGMVERFNPAYTSVKDKIVNPSFFEIHRLAPMNSRGTEVSVLMDLMIHDIDIVHAHVDAPIKNISAKGVSVLNDTHDIANVRIEFENNCVANLTASRISMKKMRKMRVFGENYYTTMDFLNKKSEYFKILNERNSKNNLNFENKQGKSRYLDISEHKANDVNALRIELESFYNSIISQSSIGNELLNAKYCVSSILLIQDIMGIDNIGS